MNIKKNIPFYFFLLLLFFITDNLTSQTINEYEVKSGILYRICKYTQWPDINITNTPFIISIFGKLPPGKEINIPEDYTIHKRKIVIRKIKQLSEIDGSDVLFITSSESNRLQEILNYIKNKPILTVGDSKGFAQHGVIINFYIQNEMVRFEINYEASKTASLKMHSQLFAIGRVVKTKRSLTRDAEK